MFPLAPTGGPGAGAFPSSPAFSCTNDTGSTVSPGNIVAFDICDEGGDGYSITPGSGSRWEMAKQPTVAMRDTAVFALVLNGGRDKEKIRVTIAGVHEASVNSGSIAKGDTLMAEGGSFELADAATTVGARVLGYSLEADTSGRARVIFNGWGFGLYAAT